MTCPVSTPSPPASTAAARDALIAGLIPPCNSGVVEGHVTRIKMLKRQMCGRAGFDLLRKRVLLARWAPGTGGWTARGENDAVLIVNAVLETPDTVDFAFWPVADLPPNQFMALSGGMSPLEVGSALAMLADDNSRTGDEDRPLMDAGEAIRRLVETDKVIAPGGLRIHDTRTDVTVRPGCCCGLEDWREWLDVADGETVWLGHDPSPRDLAISAPLPGTSGQHAP